MAYAEVQHGGFADSTVGAATVRRISWGAVLAGVAIILVVQLAMAMLGAGIGFSLVEPVARETPQPTSIGIGAGIYWIVSAIISLVAGGWVAGRLAGVPRPFDAMIHGLLAWSVATLLTLYLLTTAVGGLVGGAFNLVGTTAQVGAQATATAQPDVGGMAQQIADRLKQGGVDVERAKADAQDPAKRAAVEQKAREASDAAAKAASGASLLAFIVLVVGAIAAAIGGRIGRPRDVIAAA